VPAKLVVDHTFVIERTQPLFVLVGAVTEGAVKQGMRFSVSFNRSFSVACVIHSVEFVRKASGEMTALTVQCEDTAEAALLQSLGLQGEELVVSDAEA
jgi:hypothetical protein